MYACYRGRGSGFSFIAFFSQPCTFSLALPGLEIFLFFLSFFLSSSFFFFFGGLETEKLISSWFGSEISPGRGLVQFLESWALKYLFNTFAMLLWLLIRFRRVKQVRKKNLIGKTLGYLTSLTPLGQSAHVLCHQVVCWVANVKKMLSPFYLFGLTGIPRTSYDEANKNSHHCNPV